jgi:hypothetical protein
MGVRMTKVITLDLVFFIVHMCTWSNITNLIPHKKNTNIVTTVFVRLDTPKQNKIVELPPTVLSCVIALSYYLWV